MEMILYADHSLIVLVVNRKQANHVVISGDDIPYLNFVLLLLNNPLRTI